VVVAVTGLAGRRWAVMQPKTYCWHEISLLPSFQRKAPLGYGRRRRGGTRAAMHTLGSSLFVLLSLVRCGRDGRDLRLRGSRIHGSIPGSGDSLAGGGPLERESIDFFSGEPICYAADLPWK
jgi:hypothetical protein